MQKAKAETDILKACSTWNSKRRDQKIQVEAEAQKEKMKAMLEKSKNETTAQAEMQNVREKFKTESKPNKK